MLHSPVILILVYLVGCAAHDGKDDPCKKPYAVTDDRCAVRAPRPMKDMVLWCEGRSRATENCFWITREELQEILRRVLPQGQPH